MVIWQTVLINNYSNYYSADYTLTQTEIQPEAFKMHISSSGQCALSHVK